MNTIVNTDGSVDTIVPDGETWQSGDIRQAADGRLGICAAGPDSIGVGTSVKRTLHCGVDIECQIKTTIALPAGPVGAAVDLANQELIAADGATDVKRVLYDVAANGMAHVTLN
ncbi:MAG: hypothetical protein ABJZ55_16085 [Fuerstiella sp.]